MKHHTNLQITIITAAIKRINCKGSACPAQLVRGEQRPCIRIALFKYLPDEI